MRFRSSALFMAPILLAMGSAFAGETLPDGLDMVLKEHPQAKASTYKLDASKSRLEVIRSRWFPTLSLSGSVGNEWRNKAVGDTTNLTPRQYSVKVKQLVWDFGSLNFEIAGGNQLRDQSKAQLNSVQQDLLFEGISAYLNLLKSREVLSYAEQSAENIKKQTDLESDRVEKGMGISTDLLLAKTQLAGARARRVRAQGALEQSLNSYQKIFGKQPDAIDKMLPLNLPTTALPKSLDALLVAAAKGPTMQAAGLSVEMARSRYNQVRKSDWFPTINLEGRYQEKFDVDGTAGNAYERLVKVQLDHSFNLGWRSIHNNRVEKLTLAEMQQRADSQQLEVEKKARDSWSALKTAKENSAYLHNQARIAEEFLDLARKERELGNRTLLDLLSGETALINANADATAADADVLIAAYGVLHAMGTLAIDLVVVDNTAPAPTKTAAMVPTEQKTVLLAARTATQTSAKKTAPQQPSVMIKAATTHTDTLRLTLDPILRLAELKVDKKTLTTETTLPKWLSAGLNLVQSFGNRLATAVQ